MLAEHLILPNGLADSEKVFHFLAREISENTFVSMMDQYRSFWKSFQYPELSRGISQKEFREAIDLAEEAGLKKLYRE